MLRARAPDCVCGWPCRYGRPCLYGAWNCGGAIGDAPKGAHGFGYDPIFVLPDGRHMAELSPAEKHALSHRGTALARFKPTLLKVFAELDPD